MKLASQSKEVRAGMAVQSICEDLTQKVNTVAKKFNISRGLLRWRLDGVGPPGGASAHNTRLNNAEEIGLYRYIIYLDDINIPICKEFVIEAVNAILQRRLPENLVEQPWVGKYWVDRFIKCKKLSIITQKTQDQAWQAAEDLNVISKYFDKLQKTIANNGINPANIWNIDEIGF